MPTSTTTILRAWKAAAPATYGESSIRRKLQHSDAPKHDVDTDPGTYTLACLACLYLWVYGTVAADIKQRVASLPKMPQHLALIVPPSYARALANGRGRSQHRMTSLRIQGVPARVDRLQKAVAKAERRVFGGSGPRHSIRWTVLEAAALERFTARDGTVTPVSGDSGLGDQEEDSIVSGVDEHPSSMWSRIVAASSRYPRVLGVKCIW
ncbi:hypothetical protein SYNPS1DRAFT_24025 [Syncephalis pseudoplumigaleata]|uniref:Uncharacterized protein n=1 Tax=Syncephalis pseudoplumigaleata TaxID=1712513 RepID=A0A4P9YVP8_9FUNG|nr:hypothetical protein SYNPS1DRAFT_24025 [Syncephalis pseudoplumigaleata]|eukprot:RKP23895.1 hypothetical protein SYNPS1DRAFT_24025 [Syncephalis pseudoplumigaleata]